MRPPPPAKSSTGSGRNPGWMWSRYWRSGRLETCVVDGAGGGAGFHLTHLWTEFFAGCRDGASILDLATGNGQVPFLAAKAAQKAGKRFDITGVDLAEIDPQGRARMIGGTSDVRLVGGVSIEHLPFTDGAFAVVVSQFGVEYAPAARAARETARVLAPGGQGLFVMHHALGAVSADTSARLASHEQVLGAGSAVRRAERVFQLHAKGASETQTGQEEARLREATLRMRARLQPGGLYPEGRAAVEFLEDLARDPSRYEPLDALRKLHEFKEEVAAWTLRQRAQISSALDERAMRSFAARLDNAGLNVQPADVLRGPAGEILAWKLRFAKPDDA